MTGYPDPILMIPGLMTDARLFAPQIDALNLDHPVHVVLPWPGPGITDMAARALAGAPPQFIAMGHGLGGTVALEMLRLAPSRITRLILISTDPLAETAAQMAARALRLQAARAGRVGQALAEEVPASALAATPQRDDVLAVLRDMGLGLGYGVYAAQAQAFEARRDQQRQLRQAVVPTLILAGSEDRLVPVRRQELMASLMPFAQMQMIGGAGHLPTLEAPAAVTAALRAFLKGPLLLR